MTRSEAKQLLPIIQAYSEGKEIEELHLHADEWRPIKPDPLFHHDPSLYRIKPEPVECWAVVHPSGQVISFYKKQSAAVDDASLYAYRDCRVIRMREVSE